MECVFNEEFWWIWVAGRVGGFFSVFGGEACGFPASDIKSWIGCLGFAGR